MKKFNWKMALKKRWLELLAVIAWLAAGILNFSRYFYNDNWIHLFMAICALLCTSCWGFIFYKRAKRDGA